MKIYNQDKTKELQDVDLTKGRLVNDKLLVSHTDAVEEQGHYEVVAEYENGGKDVQWVVDVAGVDAQDIYEDIQCYIPFTAKELAVMQIATLKQQLVKYKEDVEQVDLFGMQREDYEQKKQLCAGIVLQLRELEKSL